MFSNNFFDRREAGYDDGEMRNHGGPSEYGNQRLSNQIRSFKNTNWNGLSPRNKENQARYQRVRESPSAYENYEGQDLEAGGPPITRKRPISPKLGDDCLSKRLKGQDEVFMRQRQQAPPPINRETFISPGWYSDAEFQLPKPPKTHVGSPRSRWVGPEIADGHRWGSADGEGFGNVLPPSGTGYSNRPEKNNYGASHQKNDPLNFGRRIKNGMLKRFHDSPNQKRYQGRQVVDLTTPERIYRNRTVVLSSTNTGSTMRRATETEPTDPENDWDSDIQDYKNANLREYVPIDVVDHHNHHHPNPYPENRPKSAMHGSGNSRLSHPRQSFKNENYTDYPFSYKNPPKRHFESPRLRQFAPAPNKSYCDGDMYRQGADSNDVQSDGNDTTIEFKIQASKSRKKRNSSTNRPSASGYSSQDIGTLRSREENCENSLSRIRGPEPSKTSKQSTIQDKIVRSFNSDEVQHVVLKQTAAQRTAALEKERAEQLRQKRAMDSIAQKEKRAKELHEANDLFEESTIDVVAQARIREANDLERARKQIKDEAKIVEECHKLGQERVEAYRKGVTAQEKEEFISAKKQMRDANRQEEEKKERERLNAKRKSADQIRRLKQVNDEEARLKRLDAQKEAIKMSAATLRPVKRAAAKPNLAGNAQVEADTAEDSGNASDGGMFVSIDVDPVEELSRELSTVGTDKDVVDEPASLQGLEASMVNDEPASAEEPKVAAVNNEPANAENSETAPASDKAISIENPETVPTNDELAGKQKLKSVQDQSGSQSFAAASTAQESDAVVDRQKSPQPTEVSAVEKPTLPVNANLSANHATVPSVEKTQVPVSAVKPTSMDNTHLKPEATAVLSVTEPRISISMAEQSKPVVKTSNTTASSEKKDSIPRGTGGVSISAVASDGRRRPPEASKPRVTQPTIIDPIRFTGGGRVTQNIRNPGRTASAATSHAPKRPQNKNVDDEENDTQAKLLKTLKEVEDLKNKASAEEELRKKEWDARMMLLDAARNPQDRQDVLTSRYRTELRKSRSVPPNLANENRASSSAGHAKAQSYFSQIEFVSNVASQAKGRKKSEQDRLAKYEKDKANRRKRYDREIRVVLTGQGVEPDDEKISKQVDEKMAVWDENRRKKEHRESGSKDLFGSISHQDNPGAADTDKDLNSPPNLLNSDDEGLKDPQAVEKQERAQAVRAGVEFLAAQNSVGNGFATAASKFRIQDFDSDESEEDPDEEPEMQAASVPQPGLESSDEMDDAETDETLNPTLLDTSIIPPLPQVPQSPRSKTAFLPDIVNPREQDMMHSYSVRHRAERENKTYESVIIGSFHSLEEANAFAQLKTSEFYLGPSTGKSETHSDENLYLGQVTTNKEKDRREIVWVTREIVYIGDTANVRRGDIKTIIVPKVFNVMQVLHGENGTHVGSIVATSSIKTLANKKAVDQFLALSRPSRPRLDSMAQYNDEVVPMARQRMAEAEAQDVTMELEGFIPDTEKTFTISISENPVLGPLN